MVSYSRLFVSPAFLASALGLSLVLAAPVSTSVAATKKKASASTKKTTTINKQTKLKTTATTKQPAQQSFVTVTTPLLTMTYNSTGQASGLTKVDWYTYEDDIVTAGNDGYLRLWDSTTGANTDTLAGPAINGSATLKAPMLAMATDEVLGSAYTGGMFGTWITRIGSWKLEDQFPNQGATIRAVDVSPDRKLVATGAGAGPKYSGNTVWIGNSALGTKISELNPSTGAAIFGDVISVAFSPNSAQIAVATDAQQVSIWDVATATKLRNIVLPDLTVDGDFAMSVEWNPAGTELLVTGLHKAPFAGAIWRYNASNGALIAATPQPSIVHRLTYNTAGTQFATAHFDGYAKVWDAATFTVLKEFKTNGPTVDATFSKGGNKLASVGARSTVEVWAV
jgi:WD40 repeat protein